MMIQDKGQYRWTGANFNLHSDLNADADADAYADTDADADTAAAFVISGVIGQIREQTALVPP